MLSHDQTIYSETSVNVIASIIVVGLLFLGTIGFLWGKYKGKQRRKFARNFGSVTTL